MGDPDRRDILYCMHELGGVRLKNKYHNIVACCFISNDMSKVTSRHRCGQQFNT